MHEVEAKRNELVSFMGHGHAAFLAATRPTAAGDLLQIHKYDASTTALLCSVSWEL